MDGADGSLVVGQDGGGEVIEVTTVDASHVPVVLDADLCEGGHGDVVVTVVGEIPHELTEQIESGQSMVVVQEVVGVVDPDDREDEDDDAGEDPDAMLEGLEGLAGVDDGVGEDGDEDEDGLDEEDMMDDSTLKFHCPACERIFDRKNAFYGHLRGHTDVIFRCDQEGCMQEFFTLAKLRRHQKEEHDSERPFKCNRCTKAFTSDKLLDYHVKRIHEASRPNICRICSKGFVKRSDLKQHLRLHLGIKKNVCPECNRPFAHSSNLYRHMKVHSKDAPYQCAVCHKHFLQVSGLNQHSRIHLKEQSDQKRSGKMASSNLAEPVLAQSDTFRKTPEPVDQIRFNNENGILQGVQIQVIEDSVQKEQNDDEEGELIQPAVQEGQNVMRDFVEADEEEIEEDENCEDGTEMDSQEDTLIETNKKELFTESEMLELVPTAAATSADPNNSTSADTTEATTTVRKSGRMSGKSFMCKKCGETFLNEGVAKTHLQEAHFTTGKSLMCTYCGKVLDDLKLAQFHLQVVHDKWPKESFMEKAQKAKEAALKRNLLKKQEQLKNLLQMGEMETASRKPDVDEKVTTIFDPEIKTDPGSASVTAEDDGSNGSSGKVVQIEKQIEAIKIRLKKNSMDLSFACPVCQKRFGSSVLLKRHVSLHKNFTCFKCQRMYSSASYIMSHRCKAPLSGSKVETLDHGAFLTRPSPLGAATSASGKRRGRPRLNPLSPPAPTVVPKIVKKAEVRRRRRVGLNDLENFLQELRSLSPNRTVKSKQGATSGREEVKLTVFEDQLADFTRPSTQELVQKLRSMVFEVNLVIKPRPADGDDEAFSSDGEADINDDVEHEDILDPVGRRKGDSSEDSDYSDYAVMATSEDTATRELPDDSVRLNDRYIVTEVDGESVVTKQNIDDSTTDYYDCDLEQFMEYVPENKEQEARTAEEDLANRLALYSRSEPMKRRNRSNRLSVQDSGRHEEIDSCAVDLEEVEEPPSLSAEAVEEASKNSAESDGEDSSFQFFKITSPVVGDLTSSNILTISTDDDKNWVVVYRRQAPRMSSFSDRSNRFQASTSPPDKHFGASGSRCRKRVSNTSKVTAIPSTIVIQDPVDYKAAIKTMKTGAEHKGSPDGLSDAGTMIANDEITNEEALLGAPSSFESNELLEDGGKEASGGTQGQQISSGDCEESSQGYFTMKGEESEKVINTKYGAFIQNEDGTFRCDVCRKAFSRAESLSQHMGVHDASLTVQCDQCDEKFAWKSTLRKHKINVHSGCKVEEIPCTEPWCDRVFKSVTHCRIHVKRDHLMERDHECYECGKKFFLKDDLKNHIRVHTGVKPYSCNICGKAFKHISHRNRHQSCNHHEERPYSCELCKKGFAGKAHLLTHFRRYHHDLGAHQVDTLLSVMLK